MRNKLVLLLMFFCFIFTACGSSDDSGVHQFSENKSTRLLRLNIQDYGCIDFRIYTDSEPEVAGKFIELAEKGFYNGKSFFAFIDDYLAIAGNDELYSESDPIVEKKGSPNLYPFYGALCVSMDENSRCDVSQFYVITCDSDSIDNMQELVEFKGYSFSDYMKFGYNTEIDESEFELYETYGGAPWLQGHTCVIGQAYEGMEILEKICDDYKNGDGSTMYVIESVETDK